MRGSKDDCVGDSQCKLHISKDVDLPGILDMVHTENDPIAEDTSTRVLQKLTFSEPITSDEEDSTQRTIFASFDKDVIHTDRVSSVAKNHRKDMYATLEQIETLGTGIKENAAHNVNSYVNQKETIIGYSRKENSARNAIETDQAILTTMLHARKQRIAQDETTTIRHNEQNNIAQTAHAHVKQTRKLGHDNSAGDDNNVVEEKEHVKENKKDAAEPYKDNADDDNHDNVVEEKDTVEAPAKEENEKDIAEAYKGKAFRHADDVDHDNVVKFHGNDAEDGHYDALLPLPLIEKDNGIDLHHSIEYDEDLTNDLMIQELGAVRHDLANSPAALEIDSVSTSDRSTASAVSQTPTGSNLRFRPGMMVYLTGLENKSQNGVHGVLKSFNVEKQRWHFESATGEGMWIQEKNLDAVPNSVNWHDREYVLFAVTQDGDNLEYASEELQGDREVVMQAVSQNGLALYFASEEIKKRDREVVLQAVVQDAFALKYTELKVDRDFVLKAVAENGRALDFASENLKSNREFVLQAVAQNASALKFAPKKFKSDREFVLQAVAQNGLALNDASDGLKGDREVVLQAVAQNGLALNVASDELRGDREVVLQAVAQNGLALEYSP